MHLCEVSSIQVEYRPVSKYIHTLLKRLAPDLTSKIKISPSIEKSFKRFCITETAKNIRNTTCVKNESEAVSYFIKILRLNFMRLVKSFDRKLFENKNKLEVSTNISQHETCPICCQDQCDALLKCCHAPIHEDCNHMYHFAGYKTCCLCRQSTEI